MKYKCLWMVKEKPVAEFNIDGWMCEFTFILDITLLSNY
jgi:hypothetical protein